MCLIFAHRFPNLCIFFLNLCFYFHPSFHSEISTLHHILSRHYKALLTASPPWLAPIHSVFRPAESSQPRSLISLCSFLKNKLYWSIVALNVFLKETPPGWGEGWIPAHDGAEVIKHLSCVGCTLAT